MANPTLTAVSIETSTNPDDQFRLFPDQLSACGAPACALGSDLYAVLFDTNVTFGPLLYRKRGSGPWTNLGYFPGYSFQFSLNKVLVRAFVKAGILHAWFMGFGGDGTWEWTFDPNGPDTFSGPTALPVYPYQNNVEIFGNAIADVRPTDGAVLMAIQGSQDYPPGFAGSAPTSLGSQLAQVIVSKYDGTTFTTLTVLGDYADHVPGTEAEVWKAFFDNDGNFHIFFVTQGKDSGGRLHPTTDVSLWHLAISAADDSVNGPHLIEVVEHNAVSEGWYPTPNGNQGGVSPDGKTIAIAYAFDPLSTDQAYTPSASGDQPLHVAIGDLSSDPLNPAWTTETANDGNGTVAMQNVDISWDTIAKASAFWLGGVLTAIWASCDVREIDKAGSNFYAGCVYYYKLWCSQRISGAWNPPTVMFAPPQASAPTGTGQAPQSNDVHPFIDFALFPVSAGAVGIMVDVFDFNSSPPANPSAMLGLLGGAPLVSGPYYYARLCPHSGQYLA